MCTLTYAFSTRKKNKASRIFVRSMRMKIKSMRTFALLVSLTSFCINRSGLLVFTGPIVVIHV